MNTRVDIKKGVVAILAVILLSLVEIATARLHSGTIACNAPWYAALYDLARGEDPAHHCQ